MQIKIEIHIQNINSCIIRAEKSFQIFVKSNRNQTVFTFFRLIWYQIEFRLVTNESGTGKYNLISVLLDKIPRIFLRVYVLGKDSRTNWRLGVPYYWGIKSSIQTTLTTFKNTAFYKWFFRYFDILRKMHNSYEFPVYKTENL